jgi:peptidoglycan-N-acetylmuramic acid deacetylase PdaC-like protein
MKRLLTFSLLFALAACQREASSPQAQAPATPASPPAQPAATPQSAELADVIERDPRYVVGVSYPKDINQYPGLAAELRRYTDAARNELKQAVDGLGNEKPSAPYDLSLAYNTVVSTPQIVAIAADGSTYTGGAHGNPLIARFVWLPQQGKLLRASDLITDASGWRDISDSVREQLHSTFSQRLDGDDMEPGDRAETLKSGLKMIDDGSEPEAGNFEQFEPVLDADGRIAALRFVFPPYQVGPYSDGMQTVDVPASVLLPHVAASYRGLFAGG